MAFFSLALCTFNGSQFVQAQLASLAAQTRLPDELVVCDDQSTDTTIDLLHRFAASAPFPVRIEVNPDNLGTTSNFAKAIGLCQGDLIALADQDDVWQPQKLARLEQALSSELHPGLVFSDATVVGPNLKPLGFTHWQAIELGPAEQRQFQHGHAFHCLLRRYRVTGATLAFCSQFRELVLPIPPGWYHDAWLALLISAVAPCLPLAEPLILYRQHPAQQIGGRRRGFLTRLHAARRIDGTNFHDLAERFAEALDRLRAWPGVPVAHLRALEDKVCHARVRASLRESRAWRWPRVVREWSTGRYGRYSRGWRAVLQDLFLP